jgi:CO/xanthine dehydrogenase FAD-binding subunit
MENGKVGSFRLVLSAVGPTPIVLREVENLAKGKVPHPEMVSQAGAIAVKAAHGTVVGNTSVSKEYRIKMAGAVARRATREALGLGRM